MIRKYQKPYVRSLGEILPNAQGYCYNGSLANTQMPSASNSCFPGLSASGAGCGFGGVPGTTACSTGGVQQYFGCGDGFQASGGSGSCTRTTDYFSILEITQNLKKIKIRSFILINIHKNVLIYN